jgi:hypothetical protein
MGTPGLDSLASALGGSDPKLASLLATLSRLASSDEMPAHEKVRSPLGHPPRRWPRPRRGKAPRRRRGPQQAAVLIWLLTSITVITVAVIISRGGPGSCPPRMGNLRALASRAVEASRRAALGIAGHLPCQLLLDRAAILAAHMTRSTGRQNPVTSQEPDRGQPGMPRMIVLHGVTEWR